MMRIITGRARGVKLDTLAGDRTRPTAERTKEAVFSMLQFGLLDANVLDLFAGSGQLGLEALSRGAAHAVFCDASRDAVAVIGKNVKKTRMDALCEIFCMDYADLLGRSRGGRSFDIVFLDPPYALGLIPNALRLLCEYDLLSVDARIVCETAEADDVFGEDEALRERFDTVRQTRYGVAQITVLSPKEGK